MTRPPANKGVTYPAEVLTPDEVRRLIKACCRTSHSGVRARAMITMMYRSGLRCEELLRLKPHDLNRQAGTVRVMRGKGGKARTIGVDPTALDVVDVWVAKRAAWCVSKGSPLFCTRTGRRLYGGNLRSLTAMMAKRAGIEKRVHPHGFRHTHAAELAREGVPMNVIQAQLGHSSVATTSIYLQHISPTQVIDVIRRRSWDSGMAVNGQSDSPGIIP